MKIASWNVNSLRVRLEHVLTWISTEHPDVLALQETKTKDEDFPVQAFADAGYQVAFSGQPTYNGVAIISRSAATAISTGLQDFEDEQRRVLGATIDGFRILNLYVPNGQSVESDKYQYKLDWLSALTAQLKDELNRYQRIVILGDFNIAPEDRDVHDPEEWRGKVLCSEPERKALNNILQLGFTDTFRLFKNDAGCYSWWDYRAAGFRRNRGLRIDLILASNVLKKACSAACIDIEPRRWERPSDHTPVVAEFASD
jgi:exodeoxyribonuclease-3